MEDELEVKIITRDGWLKLEGMPAARIRGQAFFTEMRRIHSAGGVIGKQEFLFALAQYATKKTASSSGT